MIIKKGLKFNKIDSTSSTTLMKYQDQKGSFCDLQQEQTSTYTSIADQDRGQSFKRGFNFGKKSGIQNVYVSQQCREIDIRCIYTYKFALIYV